MIPIGEAIKAYREDRGLSKSRLARLTGMRTSYVCRIERGDSSPHLDQIARFAAALNTEPHRLVKYAWKLTSANQVTNANTTCTENGAM